ncbi:hypothetical protein C2845_PM05G36850 [Panicum miliaceum]|uniref:Uncharacterized protein n=1 Tax=Panicum miliaceum TaxID=4540 RepID=A0A3L6SW54_PANMI|nr:hypothetical protein C2845_PM05G36850 [Panicum miliaceum]
MCWAAAGSKTSPQFCTGLEEVPGNKPTPGPPTLTIARFVYRGGAAAYGIQAEQLCGARLADSAIAGARGARDASGGEERIAPLRRPRPRQRALGAMTPLCGRCSCGGRGAAAKKAVPKKTGKCRKAGAARQPRALQRQLLRQRGRDPEHPIVIEDDVNEEYKVRDDQSAMMPLRRSPRFHQEDKEFWQVVTATKLPGDIS